jgi:hypothetical protein
MEKQELSKETRKQLTESIFKQGYSQALKEVRRLTRLWKISSEDITLERYLERELKELGEK